MRDLTFILIIVFSCFIGNAQNLAFSYAQNGNNWEGRSTSDSYVLGCGNLICSFDAQFSNGSNGTIIMNVFNPTDCRFIPATYYIYGNNTFDLYANGYLIASGYWGVITIDGSVTTFKGAKKHIHIDEHIPWNLCDVCGLHKVHW